MFLCDQLIDSIVPDIHSSSPTSTPRPRHQLLCVMEGDEAFEDQMDLLQKMRRREAIAERRMKGIKFVIGGNKSDPKVKSSLKGMRHEVVEKTVEADDDAKEMNLVMGFSTFGHQKTGNEEDVQNAGTSAGSSAGTDLSKPKSRTFDIDTLVKESIATARSSSTLKTSASDLTIPDAASGAELRNSSDEESDDEVVGPPLPLGFQESMDETSKEKDGDEDSEFSDDDDDSSDRYSRLPITSEIELQHGSKNISALAVDANGVRCVSGSYDYEIRFWDFERMDHSLNSIR